MAERTVTTSERDTIALGERIGRLLAPGDLLSVTGPLGAGKTVLVRGIAIGTGADPATVRSPTFVLHHVYPGRRMPLHHLDLYRLGAGADLAFLDLEGLLASGAVVVEWGELGRLEEHGALAVTMAIAPDQGRVITFEGPGDAPVSRAWAGGAAAP